MAFDFPANPVNDQVFTDPASGIQYRWDGVAWAPLAAEPFSIPAQPTPPPGPSTIGDLWIDTTDPIRPVLMRFTEDVVWPVPMKPGSVPLDSAYAPFAVNDWVHDPANPGGGSIQIAQAMNSAPSWAWLTSPAGAGYRNDAAGTTPPADIPAIPAQPGWTPFYKDRFRPSECLQITVNQEGRKQFGITCEQNFDKEGTVEIDWGDRSAPTVGTNKRNTFYHSYPDAHTDYVLSIRSDFPIRIYTSNNAGGHGYVKKIGPMGPGFPGVTWFNGFAVSPNADYTSGIGIFDLSIGNDVFSANNLFAINDPMNTAKYTKIPFHFLSGSRCQSLQGVFKETGITSARLVSQSEFETSQLPANVKNMSYCFQASAITTFELKGEMPPQLEECIGMFSGCISLTEIIVHSSDIVLRADPNHISTSAPALFTMKEFCKDATALTSIERMQWIPPFCAVWDEAFTNCALTQASVDTFLTRLANHTLVKVGKLGINGGTSAAPGAAGQAAITTLTTAPYAWTIQTN